MKYWRQQVEMLRASGCAVWPSHDEVSLGLSLKNHERPVDVHFTKARL